MSHKVAVINTIILNFLPYFWTFKIVPWQSLYIGVQELLLPFLDLDPQAFKFLSLKFI